MSNIKFNPNQKELKIALVLDNYKLSKSSFLILIILLSFSCAKKHGNCSNAQMLGFYRLNKIYSWTGFADCSYIVKKLGNDSIQESGHWSETSGNTGFIFINWSNVGDATPFRVQHPIRFYKEGFNLYIL